MKLALKLTINGKDRYVGKVVGNTLYRNFSFNGAMLWDGRELSFDSRLLEFVITRKIKKIVFLDPSKREAREIGIRKFMYNCGSKDHGEGMQVYIHRDHTKKIDYPKIPYVAKTIDLSRKDKEPVFDYVNNKVTFK